MMDWSQTAFIFPGQGSQSVGMGASISAAYPQTVTLFDQADAVMGFGFRDMCFSGPADALDDTANTQPALYLVGVATLHALRQKIPDAHVAATAGHSLGEFTALTAAGALDFADGMRLVRERGRLMQEAGKQAPGAMAALLGLSVTQVQTVIKEAVDAVGGVLVIANDNCPGQLVISGDEPTLDKAIILAKDAGARMAVKLAVSVAAHSPLMASASTALREEIDRTNFAAPRIPVYGNVNAMRLTTIAMIRDELNQQLTQSVRWTETIQNMIADGITTFVEIGSGDVLSRLMKRIDRKATVHTINNTESLQKFVALVDAA